MAEKIKRFFAKKKADAKFKLAGPGHKLTESTSTSTSSVRTPSYTKRSEPSAESRQAADAALARLQGRQKDAAAFNTSLAAIQAQVKRELEAERKSEERQQREDPGGELRQGARGSELPDVNADVSPLLACQGVYFRCPMVGGPEVLTKDEWKVRIRQFLYEQLEEERGLTACLIIQSCNAGRERVRDCVDTLCRYLENIAAHPEEDKYRRVRLSNRVFADKVQGVEGARELLFAAGFREQQDADGEQYLVHADEHMADGCESLAALVDALRTAEPIQLELDRNVQVLLPSQAAKRVELPAAFFVVSPDELKREQQLRTQALERQQQLRTRAMREKDELREMRRYRFALVRVRFPDGVFLQGTFAVGERLGAVHEFVRDHLENGGLPFQLTAAAGQRFDEADEERTLLELRLVPAAILMFEWDPEYREAINAASTTYLRPDVMMLLRSV